MPAHLLIPSARPYPSPMLTHMHTHTQALDTYTKMSPFTHADKIKKPLLLIHGEADNNTGVPPWHA